jgi:hypothetical protein
MENNKLLFAVFTICVVILVLLVVQMCILIPMAMHSGHNHMHHPVINSAPAQAPSFGGHHCCPPRFWCHPHKMMPSKPGVLPKAPAEPQAKAAPEPSK